MEKFIALSALRSDRFDESLRVLGYVRCSALAKQLDISPKALAKKIQDGEFGDTFVVNGVRYVFIGSKETENV